MPYDGAHGVGGIRVMLEEMGEALGWTPILDGSNIIGLSEDGGGAISIEPGGQFELSGAPLTTVHETKAEVDVHFAALRPIAERLGIGFLDLGMSPKWTREATPAMPKSRYAIMSRYMPQVGRRGLDMMFRTATVQANYDFASEADMVKKLRVALALQPLATALFANSPFVDGRLNGNLSDRSAVWQQTDADRSGMLPFAFEDGMGFERYVDYALDVPMYFIKRGDTYIDVAGSSFHDLLAGRHPAVPGPARDAVGLGQPPVDDLSRGAAQDVPRDARRRYRCDAPSSPRCRRCSRASSTPLPRSTAPSISRAAGPPPTARRCARMHRAADSTPTSAAASCAPWRKKRWRWPAPGFPRVATATRAAPTRRSISTCWTRSSPAARKPRG